MKIPFLRIDKTIAQKYPPTPDEVDLEYDPETDSLTLVDHTGAKSPLGGGSSPNLYTDELTTLLGYLATNTGLPDSTAVGAYAQAEYAGTAVGRGAIALQSRGTAVGYNSSAGESGVSVGAGAAHSPTSNLYTYGVAVGPDAASVGGGVVLGRGSASQQVIPYYYGYEDFAQAVAMGYNAYATGSGVSIGEGASTLGIGEVHISAAKAFFGNMPYGYALPGKFTGTAYEFCRGADLRGHACGAWDISYNSDPQYLNPEPKSPEEYENYQTLGPGYMAPGTLRFGFDPHTGELVVCAVTSNADTTSTMWRGRIQLTPDI